MLNFKPLLETGQFSDLMIVCNGAERRVHRVVVCIQSPVFTAMCTGAFKESTSGIIDLSDHDIGPLDSLLDFLYTGDYDQYKLENSTTNVGNGNTTGMGNETTSISIEAAEPITDVQTISETTKPIEHMSVPSQTTNAIMYAMGERYDITTLKNLAEHKFGAHEFTKWSSQLPEVIELVYTTTPDSDRRLRDIIRDTCGPHASSLIHNPAIEEVMLRVPSFGVDLCKGSLAHSEYWRGEQAKTKKAMEGTIKKEQVETRIAREEAKKARKELARAEAQCQLKEFELTTAQSATALALDQLRNLKYTVNSFD
ncbi:hypothetical protein MMC11_006720 [Xylographa trunciseda]|nr:hypothetical protein [Xylographa trunciseda]